MYVCVHMMWCDCVVYLYTSVRLSNWTGRVKFEMIRSEQTRKTLMEESQQEDQCISESRLCRIYLQSASSRWQFKYVQIYDCVILPIEAVVVNSCNITYVSLYLSVHSGLMVRLIDVYFAV